MLDQTYLDQWLKTIVTVIITTTNDREIHVSRQTL